MRQNILCNISGAEFSMLVLSGGFGKINKSKMADARWPPFKK